MRKEEGGKKCVARPLVAKCGRPSRAWNQGMENLEHLLPLIFVFLCCIYIYFFFFKPFPRVLWLIVSAHQPLGVCGGKTGGETKLSGLAPKLLRGRTGWTKFESHRFFPKVACEIMELAILILTV